uniref:Amino acid/amide ABC transporter substrate-binding protein, HAAT family n=1 Tax=Candidatus Kentrum eta TaxID=2126337 RepID=A0A450UJP2_9GAMM|nr:MAG: amino acid/amide ABC transporter substrate-binding protein, HAAT family [Candidatus Kentron sp. H]VFJ93280.1 MAG: amino acid/amide ABC transporter substrate-binding protein, HAAT family [Candidatus Kentron sp. H]VFK00433.1 MAG: amino acid/amide ABC transporter substrate-binding protein, HAAT family [Candidatus Kentron sp. H]
MRNVAYPYIHSTGFWRVFSALVLLGLATGCDNFFRQAEKRAKAADDADEILLAIVDSSSTPSRFAQGAALAIEEFNDSNAIEQKLIAKYYDDEGKIDKTSRLARKLARDEDMAAVIGHLSPATAMVASIIYERAGLVLVTPSPTQVGLVRHGARFIFRNIPSDETFARKAADYVQRHQYKKVAIVHDQELSTRHLAKLFYWAINDTDDVAVTIDQLYFSRATDYQALIARVKSADFDVLFLGSRLPQGANMIKQLRALGISAPIVGGIELDFHQLQDVAGKAAEDTTIITVFNPGRPRDVTRNFVRRFRKKYGAEPDTWAALGYDAVKLLAQAISEGKSHKPLIMATMLRFIKDWQGVTNAYEMTLDGHILTQEVFFKTLKNGAFTFTE